MRLQTKLDNVIQIYIAEELLMFFLEYYRECVWIKMYVLTLKYDTHV